MWIFPQVHEHKAKRRSGMNEMAFEKILSAFYFCQTAFHQAAASPHAKQ